MKFDPIIIVPGDKNSIFFEIFFKTLKKIKIKSPIILIGSKKIILKEQKKINLKKKIKLIDSNFQIKSKLNNKFIHLINVDYDVISEKNKDHINNSLYVEECFSIALSLIKSGISKKLINGPISKKNFLKKKFLGITEYLANKSNTKKFSMLIYNRNISVCPLTTHLPLKNVVKQIKRKNIIEKVKLIRDFFLKTKKLDPKIAVLGLNPHCESVDRFNEDEKIILPTVNFLKNSGFKISGPYPADTIFLKNNRIKFNVILGMYHDQVLTPIKTLFEYDAINITLGLPFVRISPDHGPNQKMVGKNSSNPLSLIRAIEFLDKKID